MPNARLTSSPPARESLAQFLDDPSRSPSVVSRHPSSFAAAPCARPASYRRAWFDYVRESGDDLS